jgi:hypothetical protein
LTKDLCQYRLGDSLNAVDIMIDLNLIVAIVCVMMMVMKMGMSNLSVIRAAIYPKKPH